MPVYPGEAKFGRLRFLTKREAVTSEGNEYVPRYVLLEIQLRKTENKPVNLPSFNNFDNNINFDFFGKGCITK